MSEQEPNQVAQEQETSDDDIAALLRGENIADDVDTPPVRKASKAQAKAAPVEEVEDDSDDVEASDDTDDTEDSEEDSDSDEPEESSYIAGQYKKQAEMLQARLSEMEEEFEALKPKIKRGEMRMRDLLDDDDGLEMLSHEDKQFLLAQLFASSHPDKATPEDFAFLQQYKNKRANAKMKAAQEEDIARIQGEMAEAQGQAHRDVHKAEVRAAIAENREEFATAVKYFGSAQLLADAVMAETQRIARIEGATYEDVEPKKVLKLIEDYYAGQLKDSQKAPKKINKTKPVPSSQQADSDSDAEFEYFAKMIRGEV